MKIQAVNFSRNGAAKFEGLLKVVHDDDRPTHFSRKVDVYDGAKLEKFLNEATALFPTNDETRAELHRVIQNLEVEAKTAEALPDEATEINRSQASRLVDLAQGAEVWHTPDGAAFATVDVDGHRESQALRSRGFKEWLAYTFYQVEGKSPGGQAVNDAIATLSGKAIFDGPEYPVFTRVAEVDGTIYIDLANAGWETIKVTSSGWTITKDAPVRFRRPRGMLSLPYPVPGGNLGLLRDLLNLESDNDWALYVSCVAQAFRGRGPYPVLVLYGEHGSAKSTAARVYRRILDPNKADLRSPPRNEQDLRIQATNGWVVAYDNLSSIQEWLANALCRVSTGGGMSTRELYSDDDEVLFEGQRPIVLNGIEEISTRADLIDRSVILLLQPIPPEARRTERQFWDDFAAIHPQILGGLLDAVAMGLREEATTTISVLPRMADFAVWATAAEPGLGLERGAFMRAYDLNRAGANDSAIMGALIGPYVVQVVETTACGWSGTATELLTALNGIAPENVQKDKQWPKAANSLSGKLRAIAPNLRAAWIEVVQESSQGRGRSKISLTFKNESGNHRQDRRTAERAGVTGGDVGDVGDDFPSYSNEPAFFDSGESPPCAICKTPLAVEDIDTYDDAGDPLCFGCSVNEGVAPNFL